MLVLVLGATMMMPPVMSAPVVKGGVLLEVGKMKKPVPPYKEFCPETGADCKDPSACPSARDHVSLIKWQGRKDVPVRMVCVHALGLSARAYADFGEKMSSEGIETYAVDVRGFGVRRKERGHHRVDFQACFADMEKFLQELKEKDPSKKTIVVGESMGGAIALKLVSEHPGLVDGVICSAPAWQLFKIRRITFKGIVDLVLGEPGYAADSVMCQATSNEPLKDYWLNGGNTKLKLTIGEAYSYYRLMRTTPLNATRIEKLPTLIIQGLNDRLSKPSASARLFHHLQSKRKQFIIAANSEHLVLEENQLADGVVALIDKWVKNLVLTDVSHSQLDPVVVLGKAHLTSTDRERIDKLIHLSGYNPPKNTALLTQPY